MPVITLPDGSQRHYDHAVSPMDVALDIGPGLAKACIAGRVNGELVDACDLIENDATIWEREPLENLASVGELSAYKHTGFWKPMDTLRDKIELNAMWESGKAPWKLW